MVCLSFSFLWSVRRFRKVGCPLSMNLSLFIKPRKILLDMFHRSQLTDLSLGSGNRRGHNVTLFPGFSNITLITVIKSPCQFLSHFRPGSSRIFVYPFLQINSQVRTLSLLKFWSKHQWTEFPEPNAILKWNLDQTPNITKIIRLKTTFNKDIMIGIHDFLFRLLVFTWFRVCCWPHVYHIHTAGYNTLGFTQSSINFYLTKAENSLEQV